LITTRSWLLAVVALVGCRAERHDPPASARAVDTAAAHRRCGCIARDYHDGVRAFVAHAAFFDVIHPKWFELGADGAVVTLPGADDQRVIEAARAHGVALVPLLAQVRDPAPLRVMLRDPARRAAHVGALVELAVSRGYAGLDVDYEQLWGAEDRGGYAAFVDELAAAMHAAGKQLSLAVPGQIEDKPGSPWPYAALAARVDRVHIMAYDLHSVASHAGPVAPQGWVEAVAAHARASGRPERFSLALPNYGVGASWSVGGARAAALCVGAVETVDTHMAECPRGRFAAGRAPHCATARGQLYFDDLASLEAKVAAARAAGLGGITYWHLGDEPEGFFAMIERYYP